ncbi:Uncharacterized protein APZ42_023204 [Daphnia magna]|uniref:Uncharacterized protein n=1 Tax=Daphnia magna TaxID=35525 RepID=A0A164V4W3_9CRUS|nr:Uncharacterized protein APZ42_023204 [Daphnia magna]
MKTKNSSVIFDSDYVGHYCLFVQNRICTLDVMFLVRNTTTIIIPPPQKKISFLFVFVWLFVFLLNHFLMLDDYSVAQLKHDALIVNYLSFCKMHNCS